MEILIGLDRIYNLAKSLEPLAKNLVSPDIEVRLISAAAQLIYENPTLTNEELMTIAPEYIQMAQNQILPKKSVTQLDIDTYFALKRGPLRYRDEEEEFSSTEF